MSYRQVIEKIGSIYVVLQLQSHVVLVKLFNIIEC